MFEFEIWEAKAFLAEMTTIISDRLRMDASFPDLVFSILRSFLYLSFFSHYSFLSDIFYHFFPLLVCLFLLSRLSFLFWKNICHFKNLLSSLMLSSLMFLTLLSTGYDRNTSHILNKHVCGARELKQVAMVALSS